jgi:hypothetical protein
MNANKKKLLLDLAKLYPKRLGKQSFNHGFTPWDRRTPFRFFDKGWIIPRGKRISRMKTLTGVGQACHVRRSPVFARSAFGVRGVPASLLFVGHLQKRRETREDRRAGCAHSKAALKQCNVLSVLSVSSVVQTFLVLKTQTT